MRGGWDSERPSGKSDSGGRRGGWGQVALKSRDGKLSTITCDPDFRNEYCIFVK